MIRIEIRGWIPAPQGSKKYVGNGVMVEVSKRVKPWRYAVNQAAQDMCRCPLDGNVTMDVVFIFPRPKSHFGTGKNSQRLKPLAPTHHKFKPDLSKLIRSTEDALTGIAYQDDSQICELRASKRYAAIGEQPGAIITLHPKTDPHRINALQQRIIEQRAKLRLEQLHSRSPEPQPRD